MIDTSRDRGFRKMLKEFKYLYEIAPDYIQDEMDYSLRKLYCESYLNYCSAGKELSKNDL